LHVQHPPHPTSTLFPYTTLFRSLAQNTTLCYLEKDGAWLMLHRTKKKNDCNHDKWIGVGGKFEACESPEECLLREVKEETGVTLDRKSTRLNSSHVSISYAVFCL